MFGLHSLRFVNSGELIVLMSDEETSCFLRTWQFVPFLEAIAHLDQHHQATVKARCDGVLEHLRRVQ